MWNPPLSGERRKSTEIKIMMGSFSGSLSAWFRNIPLLNRVRLQPKDTEMTGVPTKNAFVERTKCLRPKLDERLRDGGSWSCRSEQSSMDRRLSIIFAQQCAHVAGFQWLERLSRVVPHGVDSQRQFDSIDDCLTLNLVLQREKLESRSNSTEATTTASQTAPLARSTSMIGGIGGAARPSHRFESVIERAP